MIRGGTTAYCDMYYFEDAVADETAKAGVRGVLGGASAFADVALQTAYKTNVVGRVNKNAHVQKI